MWRNYIYEILEYTLQYHTMFIECLINHFSTIDDLEYIINCTNYIDYGTTIN